MSVLNLLRLKLSKDPDARRSAAAALGEKHNALSVTALIGALVDDDGGVRQSAAEALGKLADSRALEPLMAMFQAGDRCDRPFALAALAKIADGRAFEFLVGLLHANTRSSVGDVGLIRVAAGLSRIGDARAITALKSLLYDDSTAVRRAAIESLASLGWTPDNPGLHAIAAVANRDWDRAVQLGGAAVDPLLRVLRDVDDADSRDAARTLGRLGAQAIQPLIARITSGQPSKNMIDALGFAGPAAILPVFLALKQEKAHQRGKFDFLPERFTPLVTGLKKIGDPAVRWMVEVLAEGDEFDRLTAAEVLGNAGDASAATALTTALVDPSSRVRWYAAYALKRLGREPTEIDELRPAFFVAAQEWKEAVGLGERSLQPLVAVLSDTEVNCNAAVALGRIGDARAIEPLARLLCGTSGSVRQVAVEALGRFRAAGVEPLLCAMVHDADPRVRIQLARTLGERGTSAGIRGLVDLLSDADGLVREQAADGLAGLNWTSPETKEIAVFAVAQQRWQDAVAMGEEAAAALVRAHADPDFHIRLSAAEALVEIGHKGDVSATLVQALKHSDQKIRCRAAKALGRTGDPAVCEPLGEALLTRDEAVLRAATDALTLLGGAAVNALAAVLRRSNHDGKKLDGEALGYCRQLAVQALGKIGTTEAVEPLIRALADRDATSGTAARALGKIGDTRAIEPLISALSRSYLVCDAAEALGRFGDPRAVMPLLAALPEHVGDDVSKRKTTGAIAAAIYELNISLTDSDILRVAIASVKGRLNREAQRAAFNLLANRDPSWVTQQSVRDALLDQADGERPVDKLVELLGGGARALACYWLVLDHGREGLALVLDKDPYPSELDPVWDWLPKAVLDRDDAALVPPLRGWLSRRRSVEGEDMGARICGRVVSLLETLLQRKGDEIPTEELRSLASLRFIERYAGQAIDDYDLKEWTGRRYVGGSAENMAGLLNTLAKSALADRGEPISEEDTFLPK